MLFRWSWRSCSSGRARFGNCWACPARRRRPDLCGDGRQGTTWSTSLFWAQVGRRPPIRRRPSSGRQKYGRNCLPTSPTKFTTWMKLVCFSGVYRIALTWPPGVDGGLAKRRQLKLRTAWRWFWCVINGNPQGVGCHHWHRPSFSLLQTPTVALSPTLL